MKTFWHLSAIACLASTASAQTAPIRTGSIEVGGFAGASYGISQAAPMGGGNVSYAAYKMLLPYVEYSYFPSIQHTINGTINKTNDPYSASFNASASDFHVGVHVRFPIRETRLAPYAAFGVGSMSIGQGRITTLSYTTPDKQKITLNQSDLASIGGNLVNSGGSSVAVNFGGGLRYYVTPVFGIRVEAKGYKPFNGAQAAPTGIGTATFNNKFLKAEAGFFFQFR